MPFIAGLAVPDKTTPLPTVVGVLTNLDFTPGGAPGEFALPSTHYLREIDPPVALVAQVFLIPKVFEQLRGQWFFAFTGASVGYPRPDVCIVIGPDGALNDAARALRKGLS